MAYSQTQGATGGGDGMVLFGLTVTPAVLGGVIALVGVVGAGAIAAQLVRPKYEEYVALKTQLEEKQEQLARVEEERKRVADILQRLEDAKAVQERVLALFPKQETVAVLPIDLNRMVSEQYGRLTKFEPSADGPILVNDSSWGAAVNGKIKQQAVTVAFEGDFDQTGNILRKIERYQSMLAIDNLSSELLMSNQPVRFNPANGQIEPQGAPKVRLSTAFTLKVLTPVSAEELAAQAEASQAAADGAAEGTEGAAPAATPAP
jgi:type IV pilus assembly protein PilO